MAALRLNRVLGFFVLILCGCTPAPTTLQERAQWAFEKGRFREARQLCDEQLASAPDDHDALMLRGRALTMLSHFDDAVEDFTRLIELRPDDCEPYYRREHVYKKMGLTTLARMDAEKALELDPTYKSAYLYELSSFDRPAVIPPRAPRAEDTDKSKRNVVEADEPNRRDDRSGQADEKSQSDPALANSKPQQDERELAKSKSSSDGKPHQDEPSSSDFPMSSTRDRVVKKLEDYRDKLSGKSTFPLAEERRDRDPDAPSKEVPLMPAPYRPQLSTALPTRRGEPPGIQAPSSAPWTTGTGMATYPSLPNSPDLPQVRQATGQPFTTGLSLPSATPGVQSNSGFGAPWSTGLPTGSGGAMPGFPTTAGSSLLATTPTNQAYPMQVPRGVPANTASPVISSSLPGTSISPGQTVISTALPGSSSTSGSAALPPKRISTALPDRTSPPQ